MKSIWIFSLTDSLSKPVCVTEQSLGRTGGLHTHCGDITGLQVSIRARFLIWDLIKLLELIYILHRVTVDEIDYRQFTNISSVSEIPRTNSSDLACLSLLTSAPDPQHTRTNCGELMVIPTVSVYTAAPPPQMAFPDLLA